MRTPRVTSSQDRSSPTPWAWLGGAALVVLAVGAVAAGMLGGTSDVVLVLIGGTAAIGLLGVLLPALIAPVDPLGQRHAGMHRATVRGPGLGAGSGGFGGLDGGGLGGGAGDCGGGASSC